MKLRLPLIAAAALVTVVAGFQHSRVPLYDGVSLPDEPYRYAAKIAGNNSKPPTGSLESTVIADGFNKDALYMSTEEQGPQVYISFARGSLITSSNAGVLLVQITPVAPDARKPITGQVAGNIYQINFTKDSTGAKFTDNPKDSSYVVLRLPQAYANGGSASVIYRTSTAQDWQTLQSKRIGNDTYEAKVVGLGEYAIAADGSIKPRARNKLLLILPLTFLGMIIIAIVLINFRSRKKIAALTRNRRN